MSFTQKYEQLIERVNRSELSRRIAGGTFWSIAGVLISRGIMFVAAIIIARLLGATVYGEYGIIRSTVNMFLVFAGFGLGLTATKHVAEYKLSDPDRAGRILALSSCFAAITGCLVAGVILLVAPYLAAETINAPHLASELRVGAVILLLNAVSGAQTGALTGFEAFRTIAKVNLLSGLLSFPIQVGGAYFWGLGGAVWGMALSIAISLIMNSFALRKETERYGIRYDYRNCLQESIILWRFSLPATLGGLLVGPVNWACDSILANQGDGFASLGIFNAAVTVSIVIGSINATFGGAMLPVCVTEKERCNKKFEYFNIVMPWFIGTVIVLPLIFLYEIPMWLFGENYAGEAFRNTLLIVMGYTLLIAHRQGIARNFAASGALWYSFGSNSFWGVLAVVGMFLLKDFGPEGRAMAFLLAYAVNTILIIPLYIKLKLCDARLMVSKWCLLVWMVNIASFVFLYACDVDMISRFLMLFVAIGMNSLFFKRLFDDYCFN